MSNAVALNNNRTSLVATMAQHYGMEATAFAATVRATCMPPNSSNEEFAAFLLVAHQHGLNPVTREIYAFPKKGGGIQPIVGIDGWMTLINSHPQADGLEFDDHLDEKGELTAITCRVYRKDRNRATTVTEYMAECRRSTEPWQKWPARMLRHKAAIQAARYAFGFAGIIDPEEAERSPDVDTGEVVAPPPPPATEPVKDSIPHEMPASEPEGDIFDLEAFLAELDETLIAANSEETVEEVWDSFDVESTLTGNDQALQRAFVLKHARLKNLAA